MVTDENIPFPDGTFDVVITNQVLEHVPDAGLHLREIRRVLPDDGVVYLATPNKWWLTDPHYKMPFISWLPRTGGRAVPEGHQAQEVGHLFGVTAHPRAVGGRRGVRGQDETMTA